MGIVKESLYNFHKTGDVKSSLRIGRDSVEYKESVLSDLKEKGVGINIDWAEDNRERVYAKFRVIEEVIGILIEAGVDYKQLVISGAEYIGIRPYKIKESNSVLTFAATEEDAKLVVKALNDLTINRGFPPIFYEKDSMTEHVYFDRKGVMEWMKKMVERREKYKSILEI